VKFRLKDGTIPVNLALVVVNEDSLISNSLGIALFNQLPVSTGYNYVISKTGYANSEGTFNLDRDTTIDVAMEVATASTAIPANNGKVKLWPNPVGEVLSLYLPGESPDKFIRVTDLMGREIYHQKFENNVLKINVNNYRPGIYVIQTFSGADQATLFFIKI
jgi:hypothetical protein